MSNPFYTFAPSFVPGSLARAGDVNTQMSNVQTGFDKVNTGNVAVGTDSGAINAVVLTMTTTRTAYVNGDEFVFTPAVQNSGASTIKVDGLATIPLVRFNGGALQPADILVGSWYTGRYSSASNSILITSPASYVAAAGVVSNAAPTNKVGLVAAGGASANVLPIDATFAIDTAIAPIWTGAHTFNGATLSGSAVATWTGAHTFNAGITVNAAARNVATLAQAAQTYGNTTDNPTYAFQGSGTFTVGGSISAANFGGFANPTTSLGLAAVNGTAITAMRSDAAPALSQAIAPTWTGLHTFSLSSSQIAAFNTTNVSGGYVNFSKSGTNAGYVGTGGAALGPGAVTDFVVRADANLILASGGGTARLQLSTTGNVTINAPASGTSLTVTPVSAGSESVRIVGDSTFYSGYNTANATRSGYLQFATTGTNLVSDIAQPLSLYTNSTARVSINSSGAVTINAPASGNSLTVNQFTTSPGLVVSGSGAISRTLDTGAHQSVIDINATNTKNVLNFSWLTTATPASIQVGAVDVIGLSTAGNVTINAPSSGTSLTVTPTSGGSESIRIVGDSTYYSGYDSTNSTRSGYLQFTTAGTNLVTSIAQPLSFYTNSAQRVIITSAGGVEVGIPTGGDKGAGTINAAGTIYVNNAAVLTDGSGSFTGTFTGVTGGTTTGTVKYASDGKQVTITIPTMSSTANANTFTMTGLPAAIQPATTQIVDCPFYNILQNGTSTGPAAAQFSAASGTVTFLFGASSGYSSTGWGSINSRAIQNAFTVTYQLT